MVTLSGLLIYLLFSILRLSAGAALLHLLKVLCLSGLSYQWCLFDTTCLQENRKRDTPSVYQGKRDCSVIISNALPSDDRCS